MTCFNCGSDRVSVKELREIGMALPIKRCESCGEEWEDEDTFKARERIAMANGLHPEQLRQIFP